MANTFQSFQEQFAALKTDAINLVPFTGSWTAGQVAEHLIISNMSFVEIITGPVTDTHRNPDELVTQIKEDFLNFNIKMESPGLVWPQNRTYQKIELAQAFTGIYNLINQAFQTLDLTKTCLAFKVPVYGFLTRLEAVAFVTYHTQRHIDQLRKIHRSLVEQPVPSDSLL